MLDREETDKEREKREKRYAKMQAARENYNRQLEQQARQGRQEAPAPTQKKKKSSDGEHRGSTTEAGRVGQRPYARGRAYSEEHYNDN